MSFYEEKGFQGKLLAEIYTSILLLVVFNVYWMFTQGYVWLTSFC